MTSLPDTDHAVTRNGANCSKSDSMLPVCVDSVKRGKIKRNGKTALEKTAKKRGRIPYRKMKTVVGRMEEDVMATNAGLLLDLQDLEDLQSILVQHASGNTMNSSFSYQDITAIHDGTTGSQDQGAASRPRFGQGRCSWLKINRNHLSCFILGWKRRIRVQRTSHPLQMVKPAASFCHSINQWLLNKLSRASL